MHILKHKVMLGAIALVAVIAVGAITYYLIESRPPQAVALPTQNATTTAAVTANGTVEPAQNPDLSFESSGRIARVSVAVGDRVYAGEVLAALDTSALAAQLDQAQASEAAAQAKLDALKAGPRDVDVAQKRTAITQAQQAILSSYASALANMEDANARSYDAVHTQTDFLFNNPNSSGSQSLVFQSSDSQLSQQVLDERAQALTEIDAWNTQVSTLSSTSASADFDQAIDTSLAHLARIRTYENDLVRVLNAAIPMTSFSSSQISAALTTVSGVRDATNSLIISLTSQKQAIAAQKIAAASAQDALNQALAGATSQDIAAQQALVDQAAASVSAASAQLNKSLIVAPFGGTVASVAVKAGEIASSNTSALTILPDAAFQIVVYVTQIDVTHLTLGDHADVTLDAYGADHVFSASVAAIDQSPTQQGSISAYKVTLVFGATDPAIKAGMTANAQIYPNTVTHQ